MNLKDVHLDPSIQQERLKVRSNLYLVVLLSIGILIMAIVAINSITLTIGCLGARKSEFGVRKILGAKMIHLTLQLLLECVIQISISFLIAISLIQFFIPSFSRLTASNINLNTQVTDFAIFSILLLTVLTVIIGFSPLTILTKFKVVEYLKGRTTYRVKPGFIKTVIGFQFGIGLMLFVLVINMKNQFNYLVSKNMGFDKENVLVIENLKGQANIFKSSLVQNPEIAQVSLTNSSLFTSNMYSIFWFPPNEKGSFKNVFLSTVDEDFFETLSVNLDSGRFFINSSAEKTGSIVVNQTLYDMLKSTEGFQNKFRDKAIVGIVNDFHMQSLLFKIEPLAIQFSPSSTSTFNNAYIKLKKGVDINSTLKQIESTWAEIYPDRPFGFHFLDEKIEQEYADFNRMIKIVSYFSLLALLFCGMGLFGLMTILVVNRLKEIGIRKIFGANVLNVIWVLSKDFALILGLVSILVAYPGYLIIQQWLENFQFVQNQYTLLFALGLLIVALLFFGLVTFQTIRTSRMNPMQLIETE